jgi:curved DNA-binding protein CbpA
MYEILHVKTTASLGTIKRSYVKLALKAHPDRARIAREGKEKGRQDCKCDERSPPKAQRKGDSMDRDMQAEGVQGASSGDDWYAIARAWSVLSNKESRLAYDQGAPMRKALHAFYTDYNPLMNTSDIERCLPPHRGYVGGSNIKIALFRVSCRAQENSRQFSSRSFM